MFGGSRRHRQANQPLTAATANPNAATAAASAFARRASSSSLSSAAAAAALRSRPTTPINVAEVQTKRTQRRSRSVSSQRSQDFQRDLHRSPSQSSMTERTFRSPSPHRTPVAAAADAPPVPNIPDDVRSITSQSSSHKRSTSLQMQPFRVASQKKQDGAGSWFGAAHEGNLANVRTSDAQMRVASPESRPGAVSPTSSINFSYPRVPGASPPASPTVESMSMTSSQRFVSPRRTESAASRNTTASETQSLVYDPNSRRMVPRVNLLVSEQKVRDAAEKPVKKSKHQQELSRSGSHLAKGTMGRAQGTAVPTDESSPTPTPTPVPAPAPAPAQKQQLQVRVPTGAPEQQKHSQVERTMPPKTVPTHQQPSPSPVETTKQPSQRGPEPAYAQPATQPEVEQPIVQDVRKSDGATILPHSEPRQGAPILGRKPSMVKEESEDDFEDSYEAEAEQPAVRHDVSDVLDAVPVRSSAPAPTLSSESTAVEAPAQMSSQRQPSPPQLKQHGSIRNGRAHSSSPARSARFALGADQLAIRHEPPPRSVSPRKSAMKHSISPSRGASPSDEGSEASGPSRFGSEATAVEAPMPRKKSVRVSFDDENTKVVGQSAAKPELDPPLPLSPQNTKRHWYNHLGRSRKKDAVALDEDEVMQPRPALPTFGSVREKMPRDSEEERPLVRPTESPTTSGPDTPERTPDRSIPLGQSSDHNVGSILHLQEQTARNPANISRFREPLPPVVTSMEGSGYYSPSSTSSEDEDETEVFQDSEVIQEPAPTLPPAQVKEEIIADHPELLDQPQYSTDLVHGNHAERQEDFVPSISVIQPTPTPREAATNGPASQSGPSYFDVPGGFPNDDSEDNVVHARAVPRTDVTKLDQPTTTAVSNGTVKAPVEAIPHSVPTDESASEGDSIYSDAYEDLSDIDGDGFMSLDAVVASPVSDKVSQKLYQKALADSHQETARDVDVSGAHHAPEVSQVSSSSQQPEDEWEKAKLYWKGLTSDKRKQLEQEALEEAGAEGDLEEVIQPVKPKRKKSVRKSDPVEQQQASINPERVYQIQPGTRAPNEEDEAEPPIAIRKTMRGRQGQEAAPANGRLQKTMRGTPTQPSAATNSGMRKSMRSDNQAPQSSHQAQAAAAGGMRKSMRQNGSSQSGPAPQQRANSATLASRDVRSKHLSMDSNMSSVEMAKAMQAAMQSTPRRRGSDSSETSFRRSRPRQEGFGFRKSMRSNGEVEQAAAGRNSRFSLRSMSPPASPSQPPISMGNRTTMRGTLRSDSSDGSMRRMRLPSFGKSSSKKVTGKPGKSRFGDSSDEEDAGPSGFRSRFVDSSDEDEKTAPAPAPHNMPKSMRASSSAAAAAMKVPPPRYDEKAEDSPDLPDSSDEEAPPPPVLQKPKLSPRKVSGASGRLVKSQSDGQGLPSSGSPRGGLTESSTAPAVSTRPNHERRGSFLSILRRRKDSDAGKISRPAAAESGARMDTKLERSASEISALRGTNGSKLQKLPMENWPLVEENFDDEKRPMTADNNKPVDASRPTFMKRRSTNQVLTSGYQEDQVSVQLDPSGKKKKKFGTLRRMFKLDD
ncbi:uncharacterized protein CCOS01_01354 [Colletotrichum costaricense]|uniref:Uncharacterized protein n=1 Tax=Colletotrichum costaricense TaxID=1209916 RepID=A0AAI9ZCS9_9PEZI|nr:uncharacterized protein CCOS01_01354 [Colletotrichum costaricense]KAK1540040.1 hypothetical protein CCOS01_01354 [Colletotrichum costaricense]